MPIYNCFEPGFSDDEGRYIEPFIGTVEANSDKEALQKAREKYGDRVAHVRPDNPSEILNITGGGGI